MTTTDRQKVAIIDDYFSSQDVYPNVPYVPIGELIVAECRAHGPEFINVTLACAIIEQESGGKNVTGCDHGWTGGKVPYCNQRVTPERVQRLIRYVQNGEGGSNGVGATQITYFPYILQAESMGGAHLLQNQIKIGLGVLNSNINRWGYMEGLEAYNDGTPQDDPNNPYELEVAAKHYEWKQRLAG